MKVNVWLCVLFFSLMLGKLSQSHVDDTEQYCQLDCDWEIISILYSRGLHFILQVVDH